MGNFCRKNVVWNSKLVNGAQDATQAPEDMVLMVLTEAAYRLATVVVI